MALFGAAAVPRAATLARFPYVQNVRRDRATVTWSTLEPGHGSLDYSTDTSYNLHADARTLMFSRTRTGLAYSYYRHTADLTALQQGTQYNYRVLLDGQVLPAGLVQRFRTAGRSELKFLALGDSGIGSAEQRNLARQMVGESPALIVHTGDVVYPGGGYTEYEPLFFEPYADLICHVPMYPTMGNHDYLTSDGEPYLELHSVPNDNVADSDRGRYYSFDAGNVHFVSVDSNVFLTRGPGAAARMLKWLDEDLARSAEFWRVVYFHHPVYATGIHENDPLAALARDNIVPILERHNVELVLNGHEHNYQRTHSLRNGQVVTPNTGTVYVTTGGGGAGLYATSDRPYLARRESIFHYVRLEAAGGRLKLEAVKLGGEVVDTAILAPPPLAGAQAAANSASYTSALAPGGLVSIFGRRLAVSEAQANRLPLPVDLAGTSVTLNGRKLPLFYVSATQINAQLPYDVTGTVKLQVTTINGSVDVPVEIAAVAPAIFVFNGPAGLVPAITHSNGVLVSAAAPARPGEILTVYMTGLGRLNAELLEGQPAPTGVATLLANPAEVRVGAATVTPLFAGLAPGYAGLYQVNFRVPVAGAGTHALNIAVDGVPSNAVTLPVA